MSEALDRFVALTDAFTTAPTLAEMPRRSLSRKGIDGPTAAHIIEEVHTPFNFAYLTFTTGSSAFQNVVGVAHTEIEDRCSVAERVMARIGAKPGDRMLVTYPPLVNVFSRDALERAGIEWFFLDRSSRDAFIAKFCREKPSLLLGESSFIRASLAEAKRHGLAGDLPNRCTIMVAGTPLDLDLVPEAQSLGYDLHDLYGCQEFGWLTLDGVPLRDDIGLVATPAGEDYRELVVGGLPMGDSFPFSQSGHVLNPDGKIITYRRRRTYPEYEVIVKATPLAGRDTVERASRTILRIKARVVKIARDIVLQAPATELLLVPGLPPGETAPIPEIRFTGPVATRMFDRLVEAQARLQDTAKTDPVWHKTR